ncbi:membrane dipeptidase [Amphiplicatus metriothermophilus]|uniref:Membrane dipeptidase n=2 Tax=Amphiplicatus metriothermophilus TaxID=1519374 RepID=A0A239PWT2_9PROT|nr:membrane dipeptidase [Amphiplicatus metriothermophilus]
MEASSRANRKGGAQSKTSRRGMLKGGLAAAGTAATMVNFGRYKVFAAGERTYSAKTVELINRNLVIDMLSLLGDLGDMLTAGNSKLKDGMAVDDAHLEKLRSAGVNIYHPAIGLGGRDSALAYVARLNAYAAERPDVFRRIDSVADMDAVKAEGKIGYIVGIQNAQHFERPDDVNEFYHLGQRISQLTYNSQTRIGAGSTDRVDGGVSDFGAAIIKRMNEVGMAVDVSHCGDRTTLDAFELSEAPVLITHSNARALAGGHPRCKSDEAIKKMAKSGGVMGITGVRNFIRDKEPTTIEHMLDHFDYVAKLVGVEHLGIGSDMDADGYDDLPEAAYERLKSGYKDSYKFRGKIDTDGFDHPQKVFDLTEGLVRRGYSDSDIELILGGNFKRALGEIWKS